MVRTVDCVVGLQWGSEGKGKIVNYLSKEYNAIVRSGGSQAGHTFYSEGIKYVNRQIPCGISNPTCKLYLSSNSLVNREVLFEELSRYKLYPNRLMIDNNAMVINDNHVLMEKNESLDNKLGSTTEGVGAAQVEKIWRKAKLFDYYAINDPELYFFCGDTANSINHQIENSHFILLEGTQGFGLSLNFGEYPFVTSRDVTASALLSDAGISPKHHRNTIGVMRTYPIRVAGNSGPTQSEEINWKEISKRSNSPKGIVEYTTVTKKVRRVFEQSYFILEKAIMINKPDQIALMFLDYINYEDYGKNKFESLSKKSKDYIYGLESRFNIPITLISTGPGEFHLIDKRTEKQKSKFVNKNLTNEFFQDNFYGYSFESDFFTRFLDRKLTNSEDQSFERNIF